ALLFPPPSPPSFSLPCVLLSARRRSSLPTFYLYKIDYAWIRYLISYLKRINTVCDRGLICEPLILLHENPLITINAPKFLAAQSPGRWLTSRDQFVVVTLLTFTSLSASYPLPTPHAHRRSFILSNAHLSVITSRLGICLCVRPGRAVLEVEPVVSTTASPR
ncbi:hypothetical protein FB451DRAFT_1571885, partial [Mycena latifolia]